MFPTTRVTIAPLAALLLVATACSSDDHATSATHSSTNAPAVSSPVVGAGAAREDKPAATAEVGKPAPAFALKDLDGQEHTLAEYKGKTVVLEWFSPACPTCQWAYSTGPLVTMPEKLMKDGVVWLSVNSEPGERAAASVKDNKSFVEKHGMKAPVLLDPKGEVGRSYGAKSTPHIFVIDAKGTLVYKGALDNAPMGHVSGGGDHVDYVGEAVAAAKAGTKPKTSETKSYG